MSGIASFVSTISEVGLPVEGFGAMVIFVSEALGSFVPVVVHEEAAVTSTVSI